MEYNEEEEITPQTPVKPLESLFEKQSKDSDKGLEKLRKAVKAAVDQEVKSPTGMKPVLSMADRYRLAWKKVHSTHWLAKDVDNAIKNGTMIGDDHYLEPFTTAVRQLAESDVELN